MKKVIGFTVSKEPIKHDDVDVFNVGVRVILKRHLGFYVYLWGLQLAEDDVSGSVISLSYPHTLSLLDRNLILRLEDNSIKVENDWLGSIPLFYNSEAQVCSTLSLKCLRGKRIHREALGYFFEFGYSVFGQTIFENVQFLGYYSTMEMGAEGLRIIRKNDPVNDEEKWKDVGNEEHVFQQISDYISKVEEQCTHEIVIPTSGGFDSRLLNLCVKDKARVKAFSYQLGRNDETCYEVVYARELCRRLDIDWKKIPLREFYRFIPEWFRLFGFSTHLHGMYHLEFYRKMLDSESCSIGSVLLSGIIGDAWSGKVKIDPIEEVDQIKLLSYNHGLSADKASLKGETDEALLDQFFEEHRNALRDPLKRIVFSMRMKLVMLSYLCQVPEYFGFKVATPFLNFDNVRAMLHLPEESKKNRSWQVRLFRKYGVDLESSDLEMDTANKLNLEVYKHTRFGKLSCKRLSPYVNNQYIRQQNYLASSFARWIVRNHEKLRKRRIVGVLRRLGFTIPKASINMLSAYMILKAVDLGLKKDV